MVKLRILIFFLLSVILFLAGCSESTEPVERGEVVSLSLLAGSDQIAYVAMNLPEDLRVAARDIDDYPVPRTRVDLKIIEGDGWITASSIMTDNDGIISISWYMGSRPGKQRLSISAGKAELIVDAEAIPLVMGDTLSGMRGWVKYIPGELPLVISAPHGGTERPGDIPDRSWGVTVTDYATDQLAYIMADALDQEVHNRPHIIVLHLHRIKLDANRDIEEAAQGNPLAERIWHEFHGFIDAAKAWIEDHHGEGLYLDLHGHGHTIQRLELGYLLSSSDLNRSDVELNQTWAISKSSLRTLVERSGRTHSELIRGSSSLGSLYEDEGYPALPSISQMNPGSDPYFSGGYNTRRHSCRDGGSICGFQLEANRYGIRDTQQSREAFAIASARVLDRFFLENYGYSLQETGLLEKFVQYESIQYPGSSAFSEMRME